MQITRKMAEKETRQTEKNQKGCCEDCCRRQVSRQNLTGSDEISYYASEDYVKMDDDLHENQSTIYEKGQTRPNRAYSLRSLTHQLAFNKCHQQLPTHICCCVLLPIFVLTVLHSELNDELNSQSLPFIIYVDLSIWYYGHLCLFSTLFYTLYTLHKVKNDCNKLVELPSVW